MNSKTLLAAAGIAAFAFSPAYATEGGDQMTKPGAFIGSSAGVPPPGIYMFNQVFTYQANLAGPGTAALTPLAHTRLAFRRPLTFRASCSFPAGPSWVRPMTLSSCSRS